MYNGSYPAANDLSPYMNFYPPGRASYHRSSLNFGHYSNPPAYHANPQPHPHLHPQHPHHVLASSQPFYGNYLDTPFPGHSYRRAQMTAAVSGNTSGGSIVSGLLTNPNVGGHQQTPNFGNTDPLNALQNLTARHGGVGPPQTVMTSQARPQTYHMIATQGQTQLGGGQQQAHIFTSQPVQGVAMQQPIGRPTVLSYDHSRGAAHQHLQEGFTRISNVQSVSGGGPAKTVTSISAAQSVPQGQVYSISAQQPSATFTGNSNFAQQQQQQQQDEAVKEKLRQLAASYLEPLRNYMVAYPEARNRYTSLSTLLANPTTETARSLNLKLTLDSLHSIETALRSQAGLRPITPNAVPTSGVSGISTSSAPPSTGSVNSVSGAAQSVASAGQMVAPTPPQGSVSSCSEAEVKGPYLVGNELYFLLERLGVDNDGRRKLDLARRAIHKSLQLDGVIGLPSHVTQASTSRALKREAAPGSEVEIEGEKRIRPESLWDETSADLPPCAAAAAADDILSDDDLPDEDEEERVDTELQPQIPLHPQDEAPKKEEEEDDEETATPKTSFCVKEMAERLSTEVWCEIRALPAPFRVRMNGQPPKMERMETEDTCLDVGEWNSSVHLVVEYEEERLPCPLPGLCVRLPADYPEFRHLTWLVERSAYGLPEKDKEEVEVTDEGEEDTTAFKRLVGSIFEERSAKVRRTYAEELSLYRVLVTWHNSIMDAYAKFSGLENLRKNPFF